MSYAGTWGLCPWWPGGPEDQIHPADRERFRALFPYGRVFQAMGQEEAYLVLRYGEESYRVRPQLFRPVPALAFAVGARVRLKKRPERAATVRDIIWHFKEGRPMYFLKVGGKRVGSRRWAEDLEPAEEE